MLPKKPTMLLSWINRKILVVWYFWCYLVIKLKIIKLYSFKS